MSSSRFHHQPSHSSRFLAGLLALVLFGAGLLTVAPAAHEQLHDDAHQSDHSCAVTLLAEGILAAAFGLTVTGTFSRLRSVVRVARELCLTAPARLLPPLCGPPAV